MLKGTLMAHELAKQTIKFRNLCQFQQFTHGQVDKNFDRIEALVPISFQSLNTNYFPAVYSYHLAIFQLTLMILTTTSST